MQTRTILKLMDELGYEQDNYGQIVIYTGLYEHSDGKLYTEPEEEEDYA